MRIANAGTDQWPRGKFWSERKKSVPCDRCQFVVNRVRFCCVELCVRLNLSAFFVFSHRAGLLNNYLLASHTSASNLRPGKNIMPR